MFAIYQIVQPPSTTNACPVMKEEPGAARKRMAVRSSRSVPILPIGVASETASRSGPGEKYWRLTGLSKLPGQSALTVTPDFAT